MEKENMRDLIKIIVASLLLLIAWLIDKFTDLPLWGSLLLFLVPYLVAGYSVLLEAGKNIIHGKVFDEDFLMSLATIGALCIGFIPGSEPEFLEAVFVMLFFNVGELFEEIAEGKSRKSISELMDIRPDSANVEREGKVIVVNPSEVNVGEVIVIKPGEKVPMDGIVIEGKSSLNTIALTGESVPRDVDIDDMVLSGCINISGLIRVKVTKVFGESTAAKILDLVENATENKSKSETFIAKFAKYYTPIVVISALLLAFLPPLLSGSFSSSISIWLKRALTFLVVSCPCALVISVPLTFFCGIGRASKNGVLIKGSNYIDTLAKTSIVVFDKTGTLTKGVFVVTVVHPENCDKTRLLHLASHVERYSTHPIALSLRQAYPNESDDCTISAVEELSGLGIMAKVNGEEVCVGNSKLMDFIGAKWLPCHHVGTIIHVSINGEYAGHIVISDQIKDDSEKAIRDLKAVGVNKIVMLTGDRLEVGKDVASKLQLDEYYTSLLPADKVDKIETLLSQRKKGCSLAFVGDGINDAPVLARADIGIAMGSVGADAAIEAADIVLMDDKPSKVAYAIKLAKKTLTIAKQNIAFALAIKLIVLILASLGLAPMWLAVFADVGVTIIAIFNAMRAMKIK